MGPTQLTLGTRSWISIVISWNWWSTHVARRVALGESFFKTYCTAAVPEISATGAMVALASLSDVDRFSFVLLLIRLSDNALISYANTRRKAKDETREKNAKDFHVAPYES